MEYFSLQNRNILVTGGGSGIGLALVKNFINEGAKVILADIKNCEKLAESIGATYVFMDVSKESSVRVGFESAFNKIGKIDVLINNAGISLLSGVLEEGDTVKWSKVFDINVLGVMYGLKYGPRYMNQGACIINTASQAAFTKVAGMEPYAASKAAVISLTKTAAIELADQRIRVNAVCPSNTKTPMMAESDDAAYAELMSNLLSPISRVAETDDLVGVFHFLASEAARYINGQALIVDGGWTAGVSNQLLERILE
ncbi:SDR family oxidoreductase [Lutimonas saemankumensis]|uniref:SDR family NAD(P)-dependent oxidoreductase n=1 Tax=Lutimonas saemankumensis TaxID=483016 RepID=UPI001CD5D484|nr:SDR family oxidoreductase [Lutimonas saemankumensis]MCA0933652.1 SDR family oxidoreductase [Lutimonas saemankumensis]